MRCSFSAVRSSGANDEDRALVAVAFLLLAETLPAQGKKQGAHADPNAAALEAKVRKAWEDFKNNKNDSFAAVLAEGFGEVEEDGNGFADKNGILAMIDSYELKSYSLQDFVVKPIGNGGARVHYRAHRGRRERPPRASEYGLRRSLG